MAFFVHLPGEAGLFYAVQTLRQLIRANRQGQALPCLKICDWPSLTWRGFSDDIRAAQAPRSIRSKREVDIGAGLKMNLFHYYIEHQFAFKKHPMIGPKDGSLTADELKALVAYAKRRHVEIWAASSPLGTWRPCSQHEQYAAVRENEGVLTPTKEETYKLLDDLYSEQVPLLPFPWFNVCCDEVYGLEQGPSKDLVAKIGVGGVYVQHLRRVHDLLKNNYGKRMAMWGDILMDHPDKLDQIPAGYDDPQLVLRSPRELRRFRRPLRQVRTRVPGLSVRKGL